MAVLIQAAVFIGTMALGYFLKRVRVFRKEDRDLFARLIMNVTLPASVISGFTNAKVDFWFAVTIALALAGNGLALAAGLFASRGREPEIRGVYVINTPGYNLGNIALPFLSAFFPSGIPYLCMFDAGDSFFSLGTTYSIANSMLGGKVDIRSRLLSIVKSLMTSVPFCTYLAMTVLSLFGAALPGAALEFAGFLGRGNGALAMLMVGVSLELSISRHEIKDILTILFTRNVCSAAMALFIFFVLPAPLMMRKVLAVSVFAAVPNVALIYSNQLNKESTVASGLNPLSTMVSIPLMSLIVALMGAA